MRHLRSALSGVLGGAALVATSGVFGHANHLKTHEYAQPICRPAQHIKRSHQQLSQRVRRTAAWPETVLYFGHYLRVAVT
jgi:hypothetical protein